LQPYHTATHFRSYYHSAVHFFPSAIHDIIQNIHISSLHPLKPSLKKEITGHFLTYNNADELGSKLMEHLVGGQVKEVNLLGSLQDSNLSSNNNNKKISKFDVFASAFQSSGNYFH
jgi:hypothetical protein